MPDSLDPDDEGPDPYEGQDLEGLLSGTGGCYPDELRHVARALEDLRAAPSHADLAAEAAIRLEFRRVLEAAGSEPAGAPGGGDDRSHTLILAAGAPGGRPHPVAGRHRLPRRPARRGSWQAKALAGVAAAAVVAVGATALAGTLSGSGGHLPRTGHSSTVASSSARTSGSGTGGLQGDHATQEPTVNPTPTSAQQPASGDAEASELCHEYFAPEQPLSRSAWYSVYQQLSERAHGGAISIYYYCLRYEPGSSTGDQQSQQDQQGPQGVNRPPGHGGPGSGIENNQGRNASVGIGQSQR